MFLHPAFASNWKPGETFESKKGVVYKIERLLGYGGGGRVYLATNEDNDRVAIKFIRTDVVETEEIVRGKKHLKDLLHRISGQLREDLNFSELATALEIYAMKAALKHGIRHSRVCEEDQGYVVKQYLGVITGETFLKSLTSVDPVIPELVALRSFILSMSSKGLAPLDFNPSNIMLFEDNWYIVDLLALLEYGDSDLSIQTIGQQFDNKWAPILRADLAPKLRTFLLGTDHCRNNFSLDE
jgi:RIO-like serine/threonine protein kinase